MENEVVTIKCLLVFIVFLLQFRAQGRGELLVSLCYQPAANRLTVVILKARNLPKMDITGLSGQEARLYLEGNVML